MGKSTKDEGEANSRKAMSQWANSWTKIPGSARKKVITLPRESTKRAPPSVNPAKKPGVK
jgi:hypothetical protein